MQSTMTPSLMDNRAVSSSSASGIAALRGDVETSMGAAAAAAAGLEATASSSSVPPLGVCNGENKGSVRVVSGSGFRYVVPFPWRLHQMLEDIEKLNEHTIVSWLPDGSHFQVHNPQLFMQKIIPKFFKQKSYKSFQRQLHLYGFQRVLDGPYRGAYYHESFIKEDRKLSLEITRIKAPKRKRNPMMKGDNEKKPALKPAAAGVTSEQISPLAKFIPLNSGSTYSTSSAAPPAPIAASSSSTLPGPYLQHRSLQQQQLCQQHQANGAAAALSQGLPGNSETHPSVAETYEWLITSGVPFSAFDPIAIESSSRPSTLSAASSPGHHGSASALPSSDLFDCADEIKSLFSPVSPSPAFAAASIGPVLRPSLSCSSLQEAAESSQQQQQQQQSRKPQAINQQWSSVTPETSTSIACDPLSLFGDPIFETESPLGLLGM